MKTDVTPEQEEHVLKMLAHKGVSKDRLTFGIKEGFVSDFFEALALGTLKTRTEFRVGSGLLPIEFPIFVDYNVTIGTLVAKGDYGGDTRTLPPEKFCTGQERGMADCTFLMERVPDKLANQADRLRRMLLRKGLRPANAIELLTFGNENLEVLKKRIVVALGSEYMGEHLRASTDQMGRRTLYNCRADDIAPHCHVLGVKLK